MITLSMTSIGARYLSGLLTGQAGLPPVKLVFGELSDGLIIDPVLERELDEDSSVLLSGINSVLAGVNLLNAAGDVLFAGPLNMVIESSQVTRLVFKARRQSAPAGSVVNQRKSAVVTIGSSSPAVGVGKQLATNEQEATAEPIQVSSASPSSAVSQRLSVSGFTVSINQYTRR